MGIFARGRALYTELFQDIQDAKMRDLAIESHTFSVHFREFNNLSIQESRLRRNYVKDSQEFEKLQAKRRAIDSAQARTQSASASASASTSSAPLSGPSYSALSEELAAARPDGFVFTNIKIPHFNPTTKSGR
jgi:hypothetical protein